MSSADSERERLASAIADGQPIDWARVEREGCLVPSEVAALKILEDLRRVALPGADPAAAPGDERLETGFELIREIGRGSTGRVWRAREKALDREVALKVLHDDLRVSALARTRFLQEARLLAAINHPNVVRIHSITEEGSRLRLNLELVLGATLDKIAREQGPFSPEEAARIGAELCRALAALHGQGLVHRDLKPSNVIREHGGRIVLLDFSLVRVERGGSLEGAVAQEGTPLFMAPEQFEGREPLGPATDIYGLGALLYWLVTLRHPCAGETFGDVRARTIEGWVTPLSDVRADVPRPFVALVERALRRDPAERFASVGEMERELCSFLSAGERRRALLIPGIAALGVLLLFGSALLWLARRRPHQTSFGSVSVLEPPLPRRGDGFGYCLASDGARILVGHGSKGSAAHLFVLRDDDWILEQSLSASGGSSTDAFGGSLAIQGDVALVGAHEADARGTNSGAVYVFRRDPSSGTWLQSESLDVGQNESDHLGFALEWVDDLLFVGAAYQETAQGEWRGQVHIFRQEGQTFTKQASLSAPDGREGDTFGSSLDFDGERLAVGAYAADTQNGQDSGAIYLYRQEGSSWILEQTLLGTAAEQQAGVSLSLSGKFLATGESVNPTRGYAAGQVDLWTCDPVTRHWTGPELLYAPDTDAWDGFGKFVLFVGERLLVGAPYDEVDGSQGGTVSCLDFDGKSWELVDRFCAPSPAADGFGVSVVRTGGCLAIGAYATDSGGRADVGAVYTLTLDWLEGP